MSFLDELKRRNVLRVGAAYAAGAWLIIEVAGTLFPLYGWGEAPVRLITTLLAIGCLPALVLAWIFQWTPQGLARDTGPSIDGTGPSTSTRRADRLIMGLLALAVAVFAFDRFVMDPAENAEIAEAAREEGRSEAFETALGDRTVAVLPFVNMSGNPENEYFADGLTDTLLHMLAQLPELGVTARTSAFAFKGETDDIRAIAEALDVAHVLEGSVQRSGDRVRITAQLIRARDGFHLWSEVYERTLEDIFATQDEIAVEVAEALGSRLLGERGPGGPDTDDLSAYDLYLQGLAGHESREGDGLELADERFRQALATDPGYQEARVALARNNIFRELAANAPRGTLLPEARELLEKVLLDQPGHLTARQLSALVAYQQASYRGKLEERRAALDALVASLQAGFGDSFVLAYAVDSMSRTGRQEAAMALVQAGLVRDPLNVDLLLGLADLHQQSGRLAEAKITLLTAARLEPGNSLPALSLSRLAIAMDDPAEELHWARKQLEINPGEPMIRWGIATRLYALGLPESARPWHEQFMAMDAPPEAKGWLDVLWLWSTGDTAALVARLEELLTLALTDAGVAVMFPAVSLYANEMHRLGRSEAALAFLRDLVPRFDELGVERPSIEHRDTVVASLPLRMDGVTDGELPALVERFIAELDANYARWREMPAVNVSFALWGSGVEEAREVVLGQYAELPALDSSWTYLIESPWLEPLREDPAVAARLADIERRRDAQQKAVLQLLDQPEWQR